jgi:hypothetical protein
VKPALENDGPPTIAAARAFAAPYLQRAEGQKILAAMRPSFGRLTLPDGFPARIRDAIGLCVELVGTAPPSALDSGAARTVATARRADTLAGPEDADTLAARVRAEPDPQKRAALFAQLQLHWRQ